MRKNFPTLRLNKGNIYLDNAATSLKLNSVIKTVDFFTKKFPLNLHSSSNATDYLLMKETIDRTREAVAKWINGRVSEISFLPSTTYALNFLALAFADLLSADHSITITKVEHSSNSYPWINLVKRNKLQLNYFYLDKQFAIDKVRIAESVNSSTKVVSFAHVSNSLGSLNQIREVTKIVKAISPNCYVVVDACQSISCSLIDVEGWGIDALVFSAHKFYGPEGVAVLWIRKKLAGQLPQLLWGGGKKVSPSLSDISVTDDQKFEVGSIPVSYIAGLGEVFHFIVKLDWKKLVSRQEQLRDYALKSLLKVIGIKIYNGKGDTNILLFNITGFHAQDVATYLARNKIFVRAGNFCSPFFQQLIKRSSAVRISLAIYNNRREIDILVSYLQKLEIDSCLE